MVILSKPMNLEESPVRRPPKRRRQNFIVDFPSLKNGKSMECEAVLESSYCIWLEYCPQVMKYYTQPHTFQWKDGNQRYRYTPDFFIVNKDGDGCFAEVKYDFSKQRSNLLEKLHSFHLLCLLEGWRFERHDQQSITGPALFQTLKELYSRSRSPNEQQQMQFNYYLRQRIWPTTLGKLLEDDAAPDFSIICYNVFTGRLTANLTQKLTPSLVVDWRPEHAY